MVSIVIKRKYVVIKTLDGICIHKSAKANDLRLIEPSKYYLTERRKAVPPRHIVSFKVRGIHA